MSLLLRYHLCGLSQAGDTVEKPAMFAEKGKRPPSSKRKKKRSTGPSRVVPHRSTTPARTSLTSLFGWEAVSLVDMAALAEDEDICTINVSTE